MNEKFRGIKNKEIIKISSRSIIILDKDWDYLVFKRKMKIFGVILLRINSQSIQKILSIKQMGFKPVQ
ncbi:MAG: hypothetical protein ACTSWX_11375 [Promethearchaeota archaeon]